MCGSIVLKSLRLHQALLALLSALTLVVVAFVALLAAQWVVAALACASVVGVVAISWRSIRLARQMGMALRDHQKGHQERADAALAAAWPKVQALPLLDPRRAVLLELWAAVKRAGGDYTEAETLYRQATAAQQQVWGDDHPRTLTTRLRWANAYLDIARFVEALPLLQRVLAVQAARTPRGRAVAATLHQLARLEFERGFPARAEPYARQALEIVTATGRPGPADPLHWACRLQLASIVIQQGRFAEGEELVGAPLDKMLWGADADLVEGKFCHVRALLHLRHGCLAEAAECQRQSLGFIGRRLGGDHPALAPGLQQLAEILKEQGRFDEAETFCRRALQLREEYLAPDHPALAESLDGYADLLERTSRRFEAHPYRHRAEQIRAYHATRPPVAPEPGT
jgi:tetratricopeptide (TPR) repeat protein